MREKLHKFVSAIKRRRDALLIQALMWAREDDYRHRR